MLAAGQVCSLLVASPANHERTARLQGVAVAPSVGHLVLGGLWSHTVEHPASPLHTVGNFTCYLEVFNKEK